MRGGGQGEVKAVSLVGSADFQNTGDNLLTVTNDGGNYLEWLDLTQTIGQSVNTAVANFTSAGFNVATVTQMNQLLGAFRYSNLTGNNAFTTNYSSQPTLDNNFESFLGLTSNGGSDNVPASLGYFNGSEFSKVRGLFRTGTGSNEDVTFENYFETLDTTGSIAGVYLVRSGSAPQPVPEPVTILGTLTALGMGGLLKKKASKNQEA